MSLLEKIKANYIIVSDVVPISKHPNYKYKSEEGQKTDNEIVTQLQKILHKEHLADCNDDASCDINFAAENDLWYWAIELFKSSGAASSKFKTLYNQLSPEFKKEAEAERKVMASKPHKTCKHCHSVNWGKDSDKCGQCLNPISASEGTAMSYYNRILAASKVSTSYSELIVAAEAPFKGLPLGERYPRAERKLSDADIGQLDTLFHSLNRMSRDDKKWGETCSKINKLLGFECVGETSDGLIDDEADSALMTESDKFKKYGPIVKVFKSSSNPNKSYEVRQLKGQDPTCNCPGWANRKTCKHVIEVGKHPIAAGIKDAIADLLSNYNESSVDARALKPKDAVADLLSRYMGKRAEAVANLARKYTAVAVKLDGHGKDFSKKEIEDMKKELLTLGFKKPEIDDMDDEDVIGTWQAETGYVESDE